MSREVRVSSVNFKINGYQTELKSSATFLKYNLFSTFILNIFWKKNKLATLTSKLAFRSNQMQHGRRWKAVASVLSIFQNVKKKCPRRRSLASASPQKAVSFV